MSTVMRITREMVLLHVGLYVPVLPLIKPAKGVNYFPASDIATEGGHVGYVDVLWIRICVDL